MNYTVKLGDTLYGISNQYGVNVEDLKSINNLGNNNISVGEVLKIPSNKGNTPLYTIKYTVKRGDSLYSISRVYNTTVEELKRLNNLKSNNLSIGDVLTIPDKVFDNTNLEYPSFFNYEVKRGDSLYSIGRKYNVGVNTIIFDNGLTNNLLSIGQTLKIRGNNKVEECFGSSEQEYTVVKGDSLYSISRKFNVSIDEIIKKNNLVSTTLSIGQVLKI